MQQTPLPTPVKTYDHPDVMAETLIHSLRSIGVRVFLGKNDFLRITPLAILSDYDKQLIEELRQSMKNVLRAEQTSTA